MLTARRGFLHGAVVGITGWIGLSVAEAQVPVNWLSERLAHLRRYGEKSIIVTQPEPNGRYHILLYTPRYKYAIAVKPGKYLGATVASRRPRPGETWVRGNDLHDGAYSEATWNRIMEDIVAYELRF